MTADDGRRPPEQRSLRRRGGGRRRKRNPYVALCLVLLGAELVPLGFTSFRVSAGHRVVGRGCNLLECQRRRRVRTLARSSAECSVSSDGQQFLGRNWLRRACPASAWCWSPCTGRECVALCGRAGDVAAVSSLLCLFPHPPLPCLIIACYLSWYLFACCVLM